MTLKEMKYALDKIKHATIYFCSNIGWQYKINIDVTFNTASQCHGGYHAAENDLITRKKIKNAFSSAM